MCRQREELIKHSLRSSEIFMFLSDLQLLHDLGRHVNSLVKPFFPGQAIVDGHWETWTCHWNRGSIWLAPPFVYTLQVGELVVMSDFMGVEISRVEEKEII